MVARKWRELALAVLCVALPVGMTGAAEEAAAPRAEVRGLRIVGEGLGEGMAAVRPFNWSKGTTVAVLITKPDGGIIAFNEEGSKLTKFTDDKGNDLKGKGGWNDTGFGSFPSMAEDGKACMIELEGKNVPAAGATEVRAEGVIVLRCATKKQTFKQERVALKAGTKIAAGPIPFEIAKVGQPDWGDAPFQITLKAAQDLSAIARIRFLDAAGKDLDVKSGGTSTMRMGQTVQIERAFNFPKKVDTATVEITCWTDMKDVQVPIAVKTSVGLQ